MSRSPLIASGQPFRLGAWTVEPELSRLEHEGGEGHRLEPKVMAVLVELSSHAGEVLSKQALLDTVWADTFVADGVLLRSISELRRVLGDDAKAPRFIETIPKRGYRLIAPVEAISQAASSELATPVEPEPMSASVTSSESASLLASSEALASSGPSSDTTPATVPISVRSARWLAAVVVLAAVAIVVYALRPATPGAVVEAEDSGARDLSRAETFQASVDAAANANAIELYKQALEDDSSSATAYAGLAMAYVDGVSRFGLGWQWIDPAVEAGQQAVALAPELAVTHRALGLAQELAWRYQRAQNALERAVELDPEAYPAWHELGRVLVRRGLLEEGVRALRRALDGLDDSAALHADLAHAYYLLGEDARATIEVERSLELEPYSTSAWMVRARIALAAGEVVATRDLLRSFLAVMPEHVGALELAALVELMAGDEAAAVALSRRAVEASFRPSYAHLHLAALTSGEERESLIVALEQRVVWDLDRGSESYLPVTLIAGIAALRGEDERLYEALNQAARAGLADSRRLRYEPPFARLESDARFRAWRDDIAARAGEMRRRLGAL
ncbi:MAG: winged helix-turn-helix domain-containing protein [Acidobacteriota bacterium]